MLYEDLSSIISLNHSLNKQLCKPFDSVIIYFNFLRKVRYLLMLCLKAHACLHASFCLLWFFRFWGIYRLINARDKVILHSLWKLVFSKLSYTNTCKWHNKMFLKERSLFQCSGHLNLWFFFHVSVYLNTSVVPPSPPPKKRLIVFLLVK